MGWHGRGGVEVTDRPVGARDRGCFVDRGLRRNQLAAFLGGYLAQAAVLDAPPMSGEGIAAMLARTDSELLEPLLGEGER